MNQPKKQSEDQLQAACFKWSWNERPQTRRLIFHIPNGGKRNRIEAVKFKAIGLLPGAPDMGFIWNGITYYFELKIETGKLSPVQEKIHKIWKANNIDVIIIKSIDSFMFHVDKIMSDNPIID